MNGCWEGRTNPENTGLLRKTPLGLVCYGDSLIISFAIQGPKCWILSEPRREHSLNCGEPSKIHLTTLNWEILVTLTGCFVRMNVTMSSRSITLINRSSESYTKGTILTSLVAFGS